MLRNSEQPGGHFEKVYMGRIVYGVDQVRDVNNIVALCVELSSSPAGIEALYIVGAYGLMPGNSMQQGDGTQSNTQATLGSGPKSTAKWARQLRAFQPNGIGTLKDQSLFA